MRQIRGDDIAMIFQEPMTSLNPVFTIGNQISEAIELHQKGLSNAQVREKTIEGITEYSLPNGLRVLFVPDATKPTFTINLTVLVGSRHEGYGETGMAHLNLNSVYF